MIKPKMIKTLTSVMIADAVVSRFCVGEAAHRFVAEATE
jgi:hypothetical protein